MKKTIFKKFFAVSMISFLLFWTAGPSVILANFTPGKAITPGSAITGGSPFPGGQFIAPGDFGAQGQSYLPGQPGSNGIPSMSGQPIIYGSPTTTGLFITPNYVSYPFNWLQTGTAISGGQGPNGGTTDGGSAGTGGTGANGSAIDGGQAGTGGTGPNGSAIDGGQAGTGGTGPNGSTIDGGQAGTGGTGPNGSTIDGGQAGTGGTGPNGSTIDGGQGGTGSGGSSGNGGTSGSGGTGTGGSTGGGGQDGAGSGGSSGSGSQGESGTGEVAGPTNMEALFKGTDDGRGIWGTITGSLRDVKTYWFGFGDKVIGPLVAWNAGFDFKTIESGRLQGNIAVKGKANVKNPILNHYYQNFKEYKVNGETKKLGIGARQVSQAKIDAFNKSRKIAAPGATNLSRWELAKAAAKSSVDDAINVKTSAFWKLKNWGKLNGPVNVLLSSANSIIDYSGIGKNSSIGYASTDFAADITTDVAVGVGITALSSVAGSMAAGAIVGTAIPIPIVGTLVGAGVGLLVGAGATLLMNTNAGKAVKKFVRDGVKAVYDGAVHAAKGIWNAGTNLVGSLFG
ncbi:hypothetical protein [Paenisporosarcina indica]|uniref:hypothetical protein n=1 Tax=Paenisporosarcina indica TaxID=650093 RepID=UPI00094F52AB|nr:hypothetical protein [Paenisporosarcina indica]